MEMIVNYKQNWNNLVTISVVYLMHILFKKFKNKYAHTFTNVGHLELTMLKIFRGEDSQFHWVNFCDLGINLVSTMACMA